MTEATFAGKDSIRIDADCVAEITRQAAGDWVVSFLDGSGKRQNAPGIGNVKVECIGSDFIVRVLKLEKGKAV